MRKNWVSYAHLSSCLSDALLSIAVAPLHHRLPLPPPTPPPLLDAPDHHRRPHHHHHHHDLAKHRGSGWIWRRIRPLCGLFLPDPPVGRANQRLPWRHPDRRELPKQQEKNLPHHRFRGSDRPGADSAWLEINFRLLFISHALSLFLSSSSSCISPSRNSHPR